uniref:Uncharacterized protein n=1 Tax=Arundo donax TaxID=35708 RepID=A0A0A9BLC0_ARUDO
MSVATLRLLSIIIFVFLGAPIMFSCSLLCAR